jgi:ubiquinone/menaquinone biosynthesis C-methylase UbiE
MPLDKQQVINLYRRRARRYDFTAQLYYLVGFREWTYREKAVEALALKRGATVVEIGCGTGLNFGLLESKIGPEGKIVGVDLTDSMLAGAKERSRRNGWSNVELVQSDAANFEFPRKVNGIISTFALTLVPEYDSVIRAGSETLVTGGRFVILDFKLPWNWLSPLAPVIVPALRPFGATLDLAARRPWEAMRKCLATTSVEELYGGIAYIAVGEQGKVLSIRAPADITREPVLRFG